MDFIEVPLCGSFIYNNIINGSWAIAYTTIKLNKVKVMVVYVTFTTSIHNGPKGLFVGSLGVFLLQLS